MTRADLYELAKGGEVTCAASWRWSWPSRRLPCSRITRSRPCISSRTRIEIEGEVVEFQYMNPHAWVHVDGQDPFGRRRTYAAEWASRARLEGDGIKKDTLRVRRHRPHLGLTQPESERQPHPPEADRASAGRRGSGDSRPGRRMRVACTYGAARPSARTTPVPLPSTSRPGAPLVAG